MITGEMVEKAIKEGHDVCNEAPACIHHEGIKDAAQDFAARAQEVVLLTLSDPTSVPTEIGLLMEGLHIGYRLAQIEQDARVNQVLQKQHVQ